MISQRCKSDNYMESNIESYRLFMCLKANQIYVIVEINKSVIKLEKS